MQRYVTPVVICALCLMIACGSAPPAGLDLSRYRLVDMTHTFSEETLYWPTGERFEHGQVAWGKTAGGFWYSSFTYGANEHGGTHVDAPIHFAEGTRSVDEIPLEQLVGPAVVIDVTAGTASDADYLVSVADIEAFEKQHGAIEPETIVLIRSGWGAHWPDAKKYLGSDAPGDVENLHFPGLSSEAAQVLVERKVAVVGIDTAASTTARHAIFLLIRCSLRLRSRFLRMWRGWTNCRLRGRTCLLCR